jgi:hypothetical protein
MSFFELLIGHDTSPDAANSSSPSNRTEDDVDEEFNSV